MLKSNSKKIVEKADQILKGMLDLPGSNKPVFVGKDLPEWKKKPKYNSDIEAVFVLNRHIHWETLIDAYFITGEIKYAKRVYAELENWIDTCPKPKCGIEYWEVKEKFDTYTDATLACWRVLEAGFRMFRGWSRLPELFNKYGNVPDRLKQKLYHSLLQHADVLIQISPILHPYADHNHYLMENIGLFMIGYSFPKLSIAQTCMRIGSNEIKRCILRQFTSFGGQIEGCPYYHNEMLDLLLTALKKMKERRIEIEEKYTERIDQAILYSIYATRPNGRITAFGDSDAFYLREYHEVYAEVIKRDCTILPLYFWEKTVGQFFIRSGWKDTEAALAVICKIPVYNEHSHADSGSVEFTCYKKTMLIDPGRYTYQEGEERRRAKSAKYHNMLRVNGEEPFEYISTWEFGDQKSAYIGKANSEEVIMYQFSYLPARHIRTIQPHFEEKEKYFVVKDEVKNLDGKYLEINFHLDYLKYKPIKHGMIFFDGRTSCVIVGDKRLKWKIEEGFISERMDEKRKTLRMIGKSERLFGSVIMKTVVFAMEGTPENNDLDKIYDIYEKED